MSTEERLIDPEALERLGEWGGAELVSRMMELFLEVTPDRVTDIRAGLDAGDLDRVERGAHSLRSSAGNLGADPVRELATRIEELAEAGNAAGLEPLVADLEDRFRRTLEVLRTRLAAEGPA
jgi:two-component system, sensor histidine kinase and response regulator